MPPQQSEKRHLSDGEHRRFWYDQEVLQEQVYRLPLDQALTREAALVRGETRLKTPDAIQVAAARLNGADTIVTNDRPWDKRVNAPRVLLLDDFVS